MTAKRTKRETPGEELAQLKRGGKIERAVILFSPLDATHEDIAKVLRVLAMGGADAAHEKATP
jgi:hypothetical protein